MRAFSFVAIVAFLAASVAPVALASETDGTIDSTNRYAWSENAGWIDFGSTDGNVHITDSALTGYAWSETMGWISLNCSNTSTCGTVDYKVTNTSAGVLGGHGWSENVGWIQFAPTNGGVSINSSGVFSGYAWGELVGWIVFNCSDESSCATVDYTITTDWRPSSARTATVTTTATATTNSGGGRGRNSPGRGGVAPQLVTGLRRAATELDSMDPPSAPPPIDSVTPERSPNASEGDAIPWSDFNSSHPQAEDALKLYRAGILQGHGNGTVGLDESLSRAEAITLLFRTRGDEDLPDVFVPLADVTEETWYSPALRTLYAADIVSGYGDGFFRPSFKLNLAQALKLITIALGLAMEEDQENAERWYDPYITAAREAGLIEGDIDPGRLVTRGEMVEWLVIILEADR